MDKVTELALEKIAKMEAIGVPSVNIAQATNLTPSRISQIQSTPEYKEILARAQTEHIERFNTLNQGWDQVEALGLTRVMHELRNNPDPDFALRASAAANRAQRRGERTNAPIAGDAGVRAVIQLNGTFATHLQQNFNIEDRRGRISQLQQKDSSFLPADAVHNMLKKAVKIEQSEEDIIAEKIEHAFAPA